MRVCFVVPDLSTSGGVAVALGHARRLRAEHGFDVDVAVPRVDGASDVAISLDEARARSYDVAVATWWRTAEEALRLDAARRVLFLQGPEPFFYRQEDTLHRLAAALPLHMLFDIVTVSSWMARVVAAHSPGADCEVVVNGIDKSVFGSVRRERTDGPLRVLVEGQPTLWFKGVQDAAAAVRAMRHEARLTVVALDPAAADGLAADRVVGELGPEAMAALYAEHDVLVKLSRFEGLGLAPVEALHAGVPCVVTPYGGHSEYVEHGRNGLVVGFDDLAAVTGWLDRLAADRDLLERLGRGALEAAEAWPDASEATRRFAHMLEARVRAAPHADSALAALAARVRAEVELGHAQMKHLEGSLGWTQAALAEARDEVHSVNLKVDELNALIDELFRSRDECAEMLEAERTALAEVKQSRAYRASIALRRLKPGG